MGTTAKPKAEAFYDIAEGLVISLRQEPDMSKLLREGYERAEALLREHRQWRDDMTNLATARPARMASWASAEAIHQDEPTKGSNKEDRPPFMIGDVVQLKSGGQPMTVEDAIYDDARCGEPYRGRCIELWLVWSCGRCLHREEFHPDLVLRVDGFEAPRPPEMEYPF